MNTNVSFGADAKQHVLDLFEQMADGKIAIDYMDALTESKDTVQVCVDWTRKKAEALADEVGRLCVMLESLGKRYDQLFTANDRSKQLTEEELLAWDTFIAPFTGCPVEEDLVRELYQRVWCGDEPDEAEDELLDRYIEWKEEQSLLRLPFDHCDPLDFLEQARRYVYTVKENAPESEQKEAALALAEELVLYRCRVPDPNNPVDKILSGK